MTEDDELDIEQMWVIFCYRCKNEDIGGDTKSEAMESFLAMGWGQDEDGYQMCPECRGVR